MATITNSQSGTSVHEISDGIYRISTPIPPEAIPIPGGFTFNQFLIVDDDPLLFHTGPRKMFGLVREAVASVIPVEKLRYISFSHVEADECGSLNEWLESAPQAVPLCGQIAALTSVDDIADRAPRAMADGEELSLGKRSVKWFDTPHLPHGWDNGLIMETSTRTLLCSDLFTQPGADLPSMTEGDILGPSEEMRSAMDYFAHGKDQGALLDKLAGSEPETLAPMHGSAWKGDGAALLRSLSRALSG